jgi:hypothetical protein
MVMRADWIPGPAQGHWTYEEYAALPDDGKRYEIVNGVLYMSPSPSGLYQSLGIFRGKATLPSLVVPDFSPRVEQFFM